MMALNTDLEIWPTPPLIFTVGVKKCKIWPFRRCGFETKQHIGNIFQVSKFSDGPLMSPNLV